MEKSPPDPGPRRGWHSCSEGPWDRRWGLAAAVADGTWIRGRMLAALPGVEPVVSGYSLSALNTPPSRSAGGSWRPV